MLKLVAVIGLVSGCVLDRHAADRPAHFQVGVNSRRLAPPGGASDPNPVAFRTAQPREPISNRRSAITGSAQFTMAMRYHTYLGGEVESGSLGTVGSNFAAAYGIFGIESTARLGSLALEVAAGARQLRLDEQSPDITATVVEPRLRGQVWLSDQFALGAAIGADPRDRAWMGGIFLGVYSTMFDTWR